MVGYVCCALIQHNSDIDIFSVVLVKYSASVFPKPLSTDL